MSSDYRFNLDKLDKNMVVENNLWDGNSNSLLCQVTLHHSIVEYFLITVNPAMFNFFYTTSNYTFYSSGLNMGLGDTHEAEPGNLSVCLLIYLFTITTNCYQSYSIINKLIKLYNN